MNTKPTTYTRIKDGPEGSPTARAGVSGGSISCYGTSGEFVSPIWGISDDVFPMLGRDSTDSLTIVLEEASSVNFNLSLMANKSHPFNGAVDFVLKASEAGGAELWNDFGGIIYYNSFTARGRNSSFHTVMNLSAGTWTVYVDAQFGDDIDDNEYVLSAFAFSETAEDTLSFTPPLRVASNCPYAGNKTTYPVILPGGLYGEDIVEGDGIFIFMRADNSGTWTPPAGYAVLFGPTSIGSNVVSLIYKVAGASEANPNWTNAPFGDNASFGITVVRNGPASITNVVTQSTATSFGFNETLFPDIVTTGTDSLVIYGWCADEDSEQHYMIENVRDGTEISTRRPHLATGIIYDGYMEMSYRVEPTAGSVPTKERPNLYHNSSGGSTMFQYCVEVS